MILQGALFLWAAWLFFNGGSASLFAPRYTGPAKIIIINFLAPATGGIVAVLLKPRITGTYSAVQKLDITTMCNGVLCGLVSVTSSCDELEVWCGPIVAAIGVTFYSIGCLIMEKIEVDDPCEAFPLHTGGGLWGTLAVGLFSNVNGVFYNPDIS
jgi:Amt family ammonium transporter